MILREPFEITSRLMPGITLGNGDTSGTISLMYSPHVQSDGRTRYHYYIDLANGFEYSDDDLQSGCQGGDLLDGFASLCSFLYVAGEAYGYYNRTGYESENADLFPPEIAEWAQINSDELAMLELAIEESDCELIEE